MSETAISRWRHDPTEAWLPWQPTADDPWDLANVLRLHRRAGFGATWAEAQRDLAGGHEAALERVLGGAPAGPDGRKAEAIDAFCQAMFDSYGANAAALDPIRQAWFYRLVFTAWPLRERMILAWHTHYATSEAKVTEKQNLAAQHATERTLWRSRISQLHRAMLRDEAMLRWLDGTENRRGAPNENLAREFFELFALGIGHYTEADVREAARALTGWQRVYNLPNDIRFQATLHDPGEKTILGQTGPWGEEDVVRIACAQPAAAERIAWRLWRTFISDVDDPPAELLAGLAAAMRVDGDVDVARGLDVLVRSRLFHSDAYAGRQVQSPVEWVVRVLRSGETFPPHPDLVEVVAATDRMGQRLFRPPNVAGWPGGLEWLSGAALVARQNFAAWLTSDESSVTADHWHRLAERYGIAGGDAELDFWTALFWAARPIPKSGENYAGNWLRANQHVARPWYVRYYARRPRNLPKRGGHAMRTRRQFLTTAGVACGGCFGLGHVVPRLWTNVAAAAEATTTARRLVVIELQGGNDGLNTVIPFADDAYYRARPTLGIAAKDVVKLDDHLGLHPAMKSWRELWDAGKLSIVENGGYPHPNRSHFESMDIWHAGQVDSPATSGWLGRAADDAAAGELCYVGQGAVSHALSRRLRTVASLEKLSDLELRPDAAAIRLPNSSARNDLAAAIDARLQQARELSSRLPSAGPAAAPDLNANSRPLADRLEVIRTLIEKDQPFRVYYTALDGFDTHAQQRSTHESLLRQTSEAVSGFLAKLDKSERSADVAVFLFSEFGRRVKENGSQGTDHGAAAPLFVLGDKVRGGVQGGVPDLADLDDGDVRYRIDFRDVYASLLRDWLSVDPTAVVGPREAALKLFG